MVWYTEVSIAVVPAPLVKTLFIASIFSKNVLKNSFFRRIEVKQQKLWNWDQKEEIKVMTEIVQTNDNSQKEGKLSNAVRWFIAASKFFSQFLFS